VDADEGRPIPLEAVRDAAMTIAGHVHRTPVLRHADLDRDGRTVVCKAEHLQCAGAFKFRGALNRISHIPDEERPAGVVAVSSGNHGAAVACAAELLGIPATVFIPADTPVAKRSVIERHGADIRVFDRAIDDREAPARALAAERGATFVHPFEDPLVMAGQGTVALELFEEVGPLEVLIVPMSGGGLMAGCASVAHELAPSCELIGVEPAAGDDTCRSLAAGHRVAVPAPTTIADGLALSTPGAATFAINRRLVSDVVTVDDDEIRAAMRRFHRMFWQLIEPSGVVGLAALSRHAQRWPRRSVGVVLSGGNIDAGRFSELTGVDP
jgi:threonine dehydratase